MSSLNNSTDMEEFEEKIAFPLKISEKLRSGILPIFQLSLHTFLDERFEDLLNEIMEQINSSLPNGRLEERVDEIFSSMLPYASCLPDTVTNCIRLFVENMSDPGLLMLEPHGITRGYTELIYEDDDTQDYDINYESIIDGVNKTIFFVKFAKIGLIEFFEGDDLDMWNPELMRIMVEITKKFIDLKINCCMLCDFNTTILFKLSPEGTIFRDIMTGYGIAELEFESHSMGLAELKYPVQAAFMSTLLYQKCLTPEARKQVEIDLKQVEVRWSQAQKKVSNT